MPAATQQAPKIVSASDARARGSTAPILEGSSQGWSVAISDDGRTLLIGGPYIDADEASFPDPITVIPGAALVYVRNEDDDWVFEAKLTPEFAASSLSLFGWSVALSGDGNTAAVGGPADGADPEIENEQRGAVWLFSRSGGTWTFEERFADYATTISLFGWAVALSQSGDVLAVGDPVAISTPGADRGRVFIYERAAGVWGAAATLSVNPSEGVALGESVSFASEDVLLMGAPAESDFDEGGGDAHGTAWTAIKDAGVWGVIASAITVADNYRLGRRLSASPTTLAVAGAYDPDHDGNEYLWVFTTDDPEDGWDLEATLAPAWSLIAGQVGAVALSSDGNVLIVGNGSGAVEAFEVWSRTAGVWDSLGIFVGDDLSPPVSAFGFAVSLTPDATVLAAGGPRDANSVGAAWLFDIDAGVEPTAPGAPTLTAASPGNANVALLWSPPASNGGSLITNYKVYRGTSSGGETLLTTVGNVGGYIDTTVTNGTTYFYKVSAVNAVGEGPLSNELSATPTAPLVDAAVSFDDLSVQGG